MGKAKTQREITKNEFAKAMEMLEACYNKMFHLASADKPSLCRDTEAGRMIHEAILAAA